jgi:hypothetical protein
MTGAAEEEEVASEPADTSFLSLLRRAGYTEGLPGDESVLETVEFVVDEASARRTPRKR